MVLPLLTGFKLDQNEGSLLYTAPPEGIQIYRNLTLIGAFLIPKSFIICLTVVVAKEANSSTPHFDWARLDIVPTVANGGPKLEPSSCGNLSVPEGVPITDLLRVRLLQNGTESFASSSVFAIEGGKEWIGKMFENTMFCKVAIGIPCSALTPAVGGFLANHWIAKQWLNICL